MSTGTASSVRVSVPLIPHADRPFVGPHDVPEFETDQDTGTCEGLPLESPYGVQPAAFRFHGRPRNFDF